MIWRGTTGSLLVLLGGLGTSDLGGRLDVAVLSATEVGRMTALVLVLVGLGLIGSAWISLCRDAARDLLDVVQVRTAVAAWSVPLLLAPPLFSRDGWSYAAQGAMTQLGLSPYVWTPSVLHGPLREAVDPMWAGTPAPYGPLPLQWGAFAAEVTHDPWVLVVAHRLLALVGLALLAWAVPRLAAWTGVRPALASALALGSPLMIANGVAGLHNDVLMAGLVAAALVVGAERGWVWGAVVAGLAAAVKVPGGLVCIPVVLMSLPVAASWSTRIGRLAAAGMVSLGALVVAGLPRGLGIGWVHALGVPGVVQTPLSLPTMAGRLIGEVDAVRLVGEVVAVVAVLLVAARWPTGSRAAAVRCAVVLMVVLLALSPAVHLWYLLWAVPLAATVRLGRAGSLALVVVSVVGGLAAPLDSSLHGLYLVVLGGTVLAVAIGSFLLLARAHRGRVGDVAAANL